MRKKILLLLALAIVLLVSIINNGTYLNADANTNSNISNITDYVSIENVLDKFLIKTDYTSTNEIFDPESKVWIIIKLKELSVLEASNYLNGKELSEYMENTNGERLIISQNKQKEAIINQIRNQGIEIEIKYNYDILMNGIAALVSYKDIAAIKKINGIERVEISEYYAAPSTVESAKMMQIETMRKDYNITGKGMAIGILDTGLFINHEAFSVIPDDIKYDYNEINEKLQYTKAYNGFNQDTLGEKKYANQNLTIDKVYLNEKLPFVYDYADCDTDIVPSINAQLMGSGYHGTHVAGIAAGNNGKDFKGVAYDAQICFFKVFGDNTGGAYLIDVMAALNDAILLGVDIVNLSLGSPCGYATENGYNEIIENTEKSGIIASISAGNSFVNSYQSKTGYYPILSNTDFGTLGSPSVCEDSFSVASINSYDSISKYLLSNNREIEFHPSVNKKSEYRDFLGNLHIDENSLFNYVVIDNGGKLTDYQGLNVKDKIVLVSRGGISFEEKVKNAAINGAFACIVYNNVDGIINMQIENEAIPSASISMEDGLFLVNNSNKTIELSSEYFHAYKAMSDFSSWGPTNELKLKPEITAPGGNIYSSISGKNNYGYMSGTSMAAPNLTGSVTLVKQYLNTIFNDISSRELNDIIYSMVMSTADIILDKTGVPYSPRKQGAGMINLENILKSKAYLTVDNQSKPKIELFDDKNKDGLYTLKFNVRNFSNENLEFSIACLSQCEKKGNFIESINEYSFALMGYKLAPEYTYYINEEKTNTNKIIVNAGEKVSITVEIKLSDEDKEYLNQFQYGNYIEGFIVLDSNNLDISNLSLPFLGYYGDWNNIPIFDSTIYDDKAAVYGKSAAFGIFNYGGNNYTMTLGSYNFINNSDISTPKADYKKIAIAPSGNGYQSLYGNKIGLFRSLKEIRYTFEDALTGRIIYEYMGTNSAKKSFYNAGSMKMDECIWDWKGTYNNGYEDVLLGNNTEIIYSFYGKIEYEDAKWFKYEQPIYIDYEKPQLLNYKIIVENNKLYLECDIYDNHYLQAIISGKPTYNDENNIINVDLKNGIINPIYDEEKGGISKIKVEITSLYNQYDNNKFGVIIFDYAMNHSIYEIDLNAYSKQIRMTDMIIDCKDELAINEKLNANIKLMPVDARNNGQNIYIWNSSDENIISIDKEGNLTAINTGSAWIECILVYIEDDESTIIKGKKKITVLEKPDSAAISMENDKLALGGKINAAVCLLPNKNSQYIDFETIWSIENPDVASINKSGEITGLKVGRTKVICNITAIIANETINFTAEKWIEVMQAASGIKTIEPIYEIKLYQTQKIDIEYINGLLMPYKIIFSARNNNIIKIGEDGYIVGIKAGKTIVDVVCQYLNGDKIESLSTTCEVNVLDEYYENRAYPESLQIKYNGKDIHDTTIKIKNGDSITIEAIVLPWNVNDAVRVYAYDGDLFSIKISDKTITAVKNGKVRIFVDCIENLYLAQWFYIEIEEAKNADCYNTLNINNTLNAEAEKEFEIIDNILTAYNGKGGDIIIPDGVTEIALGVFEDNQTINSVKLNKELEIINKYAFKNSSINSISFNANIMHIGEEAFSGCTKLIDVVFADICNNLKIDKNAFRFSAIKSLILPQGTISIGNNAFDSSQLNEIKFPDSINIIGEYAFYKSNLTAVNLPKNLKILGNYAFADTKISSDIIIIPDNTEYVGRNCFDNCKIAQIHIPASVVTIGFYKYAPAKDIIYEIDSENKNYKINNGFIIDKYKTIVWYQGNENNIIIPDEAIRIEEGAFLHVKALTVSINKNIMRIGDNAFGEGINYIIFNDDTAPVLEFTDSEIGYRNFSKNTILLINGEEFNTNTWKQFNIATNTDENKLFIFNFNAVIEDLIISLSWDKALIDDAKYKISVINNGTTKEYYSEATIYQIKIEALGEYQIFITAEKENIKGNPSNTLTLHTNNNEIEFVVALIEAIDVNTSEDFEAVKNARNFYNALNDLYKKEINNYEKLLIAEEKVSAIIVMEKIETIPTALKLSNRKLISDIRIMYDNLNAFQKSLINNYIKLLNAETKIMQLQVQDSYRKLENELMDKIDAKNKEVDKKIKDANSRLIIADNEKAQAFETLKQAEVLNTITIIFVIISIGIVTISIILYKKCKH